MQNGSGIPFGRSKRGVTQSGVYQLKRVIFEIELHIYIYNWSQLLRAITTVVQIRDRIAPVYLEDCLESD